MFVVSNRKSSSSFHHSLLAWSTFNIISTVYHYCECFVFLILPIEFLYILASNDTCIISSHSSGGGQYRGFADCFQFFSRSTRFQQIIWNMQVCTNVTSFILFRDVQVFIYSWMQHSHFYGVSGANTEGEFSYVDYVYLSFPLKSSSFKVFRNLIVFSKFYAYKTFSLYCGTTSMWTVRDVRFCCD